MAIANPASPKAGPKPEPLPHLQGQPEKPTGNASVEPKKAPPAAAPSVPEESAATHLKGIAPDEIKIIDEKFQKLLATIHENRPGDDLEIIRKAWEFCLEQHEGQKRASGEPYVIHPLEVGQ